MSDRLRRSGAALAIATLLAVPPSGVSVTGEAQAFPAGDCLTRREAIAAVARGSVTPLRQLRGKAEEAARGEMINAELCKRGGTMVYVITILSETGKVVYVTLDANSGQLIGTR